MQSTVGFFPDGSSQAIAVIAIRGVSAGTTAIRAGAPPNIAETTLTVPVIGPGAITLPAGIVLTPNQSAAFPVTLTAPAPAGGVTVSLSSGDRAKVALSTGSVFVAAGASVPAVQPQVSAVGIGSATISASAPAMLARARLCGARPRRRPFRSVFRRRA